TIRFIVRSPFGLPLFVESIVRQLVNVLEIRLFDVVQIHTKIMLKQRTDALGLKAVEDSMALPAGIKRGAAGGFDDELLVCRTIFSAVGVPEKSRERPVLGIERFDLLALQSDDIAGVHRNELLQR